MIRRGGLPGPELGVALADGFVPDLLWRGHGVIVVFIAERSRETFPVDGYRTVLVTCNELTHHRERALVRIAAAFVR